MLKQRITPLLCASLLAWLPVAGMAQTDFQLPDMGDPSAAALSPEQDRKLGEAFMREIRRSMTLLEDPEAKDYLQSLGSRLSAYGDDTGQHYNFFIVDEESINAFAGPGGNIGIHTGLFAATENESELAAVVAHEMAHVSQKHIARQIQRAENLSLPALAALLAAMVVAGKSGNADLGQAALATVTATSAQMQINFTRNNEQEADSVGIQNLSGAGYDPHGMATFFERLQFSSRYYGKPPEFLSTHPVTRDRIAEAQQRAQRYDYRQVPDSLTYALVKARLHVLSEPDPRASLRYYQRLIEGGQYQSEAALHYGLALAQGAVGDHAAARRELDALIAREGEHPMLLSARAHNELEAGNLADATRLYREALKVYPGNSALTLQYAEALIRAGDAEKARDLLRSHSREQPDEPEVFRLLARAHADLGEQARAYQAQAEYYFLSGDVLGAVQQLKVARQKAGNDFYTASSVEARLAELEKIAKEEKEDRRDREP